MRSGRVDALMGTHVTGIFFGLVFLSCSVLGMIFVLRMFRESSPVRSAEAIWVGILIFMLVVGAVTLALW